MCIKQIYNVKENGKTIFTGTKEDCAKELGCTINQINYMSRSEYIKRVEMYGGRCLKPANEKEVVDFSEYVVKDGGRIIATGTISQCARLIDVTIKSFNATVRKGYVIVGQKRYEVEKVKKLDVDICHICGDAINKVTTFHVCGRCKRVYKIENQDELVESLLVNYIACCVLKASKQRYNLFYKNRLDLGWVK